MQYMLLIYGDQNGWETLSEAERGEMMQAYGSFSQELRDSGSLVAGDALEPTETATTVRVRDDETLTTDGPFAETKEQLGGVFVTDLPDLDEAIRIAALVPAASYGTLEIRPLISR